MPSEDTSSVTLQSSSGSERSSRPANQSTSVNTARPSEHAPVSVISQATVIECGSPCRVDSDDGPMVLTKGRAELYFRDDTRQVFVCALKKDDVVFATSSDTMQLLLTVQDTTSLHPVEPSEIASAGKRWVKQILLGLRAGRYSFPLDVSLVPRTFDQGSMASFNAGVADALRTSFQQFEQSERQLRASRLHIDSLKTTPDSPEQAVLEAQELLNLPASAVDQLPAATDDLTQLAGAAGLRTRIVALEKNWTRSDQGLLLLRTDTGDKVFCARYTERGYCLNDGSLIEQRTDLSLDSRAWYVFEPLPLKVDGFWSLASFVLQRNRRELALTAKVGLAVALLGALVPVATGWVLADIAPSGDTGMLLSVAVALVFSVFVTATLETVRSRAISRIQGRSSLRLSAALYDRLLQLPTHFFKSHTSGDLNQRLTNADDIRDLILSLALTVGLSAVLSIVYLFVMMAYDTFLASLSFLLAAVYMLAVFGLRIIQRPIIKQLYQVDGVLAQRSHELIDGMAKLRSCAAEERALSRWSALYAKERLLSRRAKRLAAVFASFSGLWQVITLAILFATVTRHAGTQLSAGHVIAFLTAFGIFQGAFVSLSSALLSIYSAQPQIDRILPVLRARPESRRQQADPGILQGRVELRSVSFSYDKGNTPIIRNLSLSVRPGQHIALVGTSGSGKSTLLRLLLGFEEPDSGAVLYDGQDLSQLDTAQVRRQIGVVLQSSALFSGSIAENIRGPGNATIEDCWHAAEQAGLAGDLTHFPMGLNTILTDGGSTLSGGQRQRVLIARALVSHPRLLYFDEATSALDNSTQAVVRRTLDALALTRVTIAHRLSTVKHADVICVLHNGRLIEQGRYEELMKTGGAFATFATRQLTDD